MIGKYGEFLLGIKEIVSPFLYCKYDHCHLKICCVVVSFSVGEESRDEVNWMPMIILLLRENSAKTYSRTISFYSKQIVVGGHGKSRCGSDGLFECFKCFLTFFGSFKLFFFRGKSVEWSSDGCKVFDKASIEVEESKETSKFLLFSRNWPFCYSCDLSRIHLHFILRND